MDRGGHLGTERLNDLPKEHEHFRSHDASDSFYGLDKTSSLYFALFAFVVAFIVCLAVKLYCRLTVGKCTSQRSMSGKTVIITGANAGIGKETACELARRGARVIIACRSLTKAQDAADEIEQRTRGKKVIIKQLDLCSFKSIRAFADDINNNEERLDVLINNAGIVPFPNRVETVDGHEQTFQTNHLGPFLLTNLLLDKLKKSAPSRIITLSSSLHHLGQINYDNFYYRDYKVPMKVYSDTKLANILFTRELARRLYGTGVTANACHPGAVQTDINSTYPGFLNFCLNTIFFCFGKVFGRYTQALLMGLAAESSECGGNITKTPEEGAQTTLHLAISEEVENTTGEYFKDCHVVKGSTASRDILSAAKLWHSSEKLTGLVN